MAIIVASPNAVIRGQQALEQLIVGKYKISFKQFEGGTTSYSLTGLLDVIQPAYENMISLGYDCVLNQMDAGVWELDVSYPADLLTNSDTMQEAFPEIVWNYVKTKQEQAIFDCTDRPIISSLSIQTRELIELAIKQSSTNQKIAYNPSELANATSVYNLMRLGVKGRFVNYPTVSRTITVTKKFNPYWQIAFEGKILTSQTWANYYAVPFWITPQLPVSTIQNDAQSGIASVYGWLEVGSQRGNIHRNRQVISQTW